MKIALYNRPNHPPNSDFQHGGYVTALVGATTPEEERQLEERRSITLPGDDWYGGELEQVALFSFDGPAPTIKGYHDTNHEGFESIGDCRATWYFASLADLENRLKDDPPRKRE
jgi:hypothetical protein